MTAPAATPAAPVATGYDLAELRVHAHGYCLHCGNVAAGGCAGCNGTGYRPREQAYCKARWAGELCWEPRAMVTCFECGGAGGPVPRPSLELSRWHRGLTHETDPAYPTVEEEKCWRCRGQGRIQSWFCPTHHAEWAVMPERDQASRWGGAAMEEHIAMRRGGKPAWLDRKQVPRGAGGEIRR